MALRWWGRTFHDWPSFVAVLKKKGIDPKAWSAKWPAAARIIGSPYATPAPSGTGTGAATSTSTVTTTQSQQSNWTPVGSKVIPGIGTYGQLQNQAQLAYERSLAQLSQQQQDILHAYGLQGQVDPKTLAVSGVKEDPTSQYGAIPMLRRDQAGQLMENQEIQAQRNIGSSGLAAQAEEELKYEHGAQVADLFQRFRDAMQQTQNARMDAASQLGMANVGILQEAIQNAIQNNMFTPVPANAYTSTSTTISSGYSSNPSAKQIQQKKKAIAQMKVKKRRKKKGGL